MQINKSCGILLLNTEKTHFLLLRLPDKWDLPKGRKKKNESDLETALREFIEETSISSHSIELIDDFIFTKLQYKQNKITQEYTVKEFIMFLAVLKKEVVIKPSIHISYKWFEIDKEHDFREFIIKHLIRFTKEYLKNK